MSYIPPHKKQQINSMQNNNAVMITNNNASVNTNMNSNTVNKSFNGYSNNNMQGYNGNNSNYNPYSKQNYNSNTNNYSNNNSNFSSNNFVSTFKSNNNTSNNVGSSNTGNNNGNNFGNSSQTFTSNNVNSNFNSNSNGNFSSNNNFNSNNNFSNNNNNFGNNYNNNSYNNNDNSGNSFRKYNNNNNNYGSYSNNSRSFKGNGYNNRRGRGGRGSRGGGGFYRNNNKYGNNNGRFNKFGNNYSTYTDNQSYSDRSKERNVALEKELFHSSEEVTQGIKFNDYKSIQVEMTGSNKPIPIIEFNQSGLHDDVLGNVKLCGFKTPTPVQKNAVPCVLNNRDLMACAQTGSGKTAAFLLPIISQLYTKGFNSTFYQGQCHPISCVMSPTRELAIQIHIQARKFLYRTGMRSSVVYGGADRRKQSRDLKYGVEILVATPGRLNDFIEQGNISMDSTRYCVLDEADRMLDMGFMPQIKSIINGMPSKGNRVMLMFSATFPREMQKLAQEFLNDYIFLAVGRVGSTSNNITQKLEYCLDYDKTNKCIKIIAEKYKYKNNSRILIFVEKKKDASRVEKELQKNNIPAISIHGDRSQREREHALKVFRKGKIPILVATDVAARGLDVPDVMFVINYDLPGNIDSYVHRIGRTGRCGNEGEAISFVNENNKNIISDLYNVLKESKSNIPHWFAEMSSNIKFYKKYKNNNYKKNNYSKNKYNNNNGYNNNNRYNSKFGGVDFRSQYRNKRSNNNSNNSNNGGNKSFSDWVNKNRSNNNNDNDEGIALDNNATDYEDSW